MLVKRTNSGKLSLNMSLTEREKLFGAFCNFLESESIVMWQFKVVKDEADVMRRLFYHTLNEIMVSKEFKLQFNTFSKIQLTQSQSIATLWLLRDYDSDMTLLQMKGELHKTLS